MFSNTYKTFYKHIRYTICKYASIVSVNAVDMTNLPENLKPYKKLLPKEKSIFDAICYSCGKLLYGNVSKGHKFTKHT